MSIYAVILTSTNICDNIIVWNPVENPWNPPENHYVVNIDNLEVGIGWHYDQASSVWTGPPSIIASFSPSPIFLTQQTTLAWESQNATSVTVNGAAADLNGSQVFTPSAVGKFSISVTATGLAGSVNTTAIVNVVSTQAELGA